MLNVSLSYGLVIRQVIPFNAEGKQYLIGYAITSMRQYYVQVGGSILLLVMDKKVYYLVGSIGGSVGAYIPTLFGDKSLFSFWSIMGSLIGGLGAIYLTYKLSQ